MARTSPTSDAHFPPPARGADQELDRVEDAIRRMDPDGQAFGRVLRDTYDWLYDGQRTGRYKWTDLRKTEKTHMGSLVEIELQREFDEFMDGESLDYRIAGVDVDCKFSQQLRGWEIPNNIRRDRQICLLVWANEDECRWEAGLVRAGSDDDAWFYTPSKGNQDGKRRLSAEGESSVRWLWPGGVLATNQLLHLAPAARQAILSGGTAGRASGQSRVNELFRRIQGEPVKRTTIETVARQKDPMKRALDARLHQHLGQEGILVLCGDWVAHRAAAETLLLPPLGDSEFLAVRVVPADGRGEPGSPPSAVIGGASWRLATDDDPVVAVPPLPPTLSTGLAAGG